MHRLGGAGAYTITRYDRPLIICLAVALLASCMSAPGVKTVTWEEIAAQTAPLPDQRIRYGSDSPHQYGELRLPTGPAPYPMAIVLHGGCWRSDYDHDYMDSLSARLTRAGIATWTLEFRRLGNIGGGWPGTFLDVAAGIDHVRILASEYPIDRGRIIIIGHSSGGHLALWAASRHKLPQENPLHRADPLAVNGVVSLAGISDLRAYGAGRGSCNRAVSELLGGDVARAPLRYAHANPLNLLPLNVPAVLIHGGRDRIVPAFQSQAYVEKASAQEHDILLVTVDDAGHFDLVAPFATPVWEVVEREIRQLLDRLSP